MYDNCIVISPNHKYFDHNLLLLLVYIMYILINMGPNNSVVIICSVRPNFHATMRILKSFFLSSCCFHRDSVQLTGG